MEEKTLNILEEFKIREELYTNNTAVGILNQYTRYGKITERQQKFLNSLIFKKKLYPFQEEGVAFIERNNGNALVADDPGCGKTLIFLNYIHKHPELRPILIICPGSLKYNWLNEWNACLNYGTPQVLEGEKPYEIKSDVVIINFDIVLYWAVELIMYNFKCVAIDEIHQIMNLTAKKTQATHNVCKNIPSKVGMSATPILNRPKELYSVVSLICPGLFPNFMDFQLRYCNLKMDRWGRWNDNGASNIDELNKLLTTTVMIRRKKVDVLKDLPKKTRSVIPVEITNRREYAEKEIEFIKWGKSAGNLSNGVVKTEALKQIVFRGKFKYITEFIGGFYQAGEKLVVGCTNNIAIQMFKKEYGKNSVFCTKEMSAEERQGVVDKFQSDSNIFAFFSTYKVGGVGYTLTKACNIILTQIGWTPTIHEQFEDRVCRITQTRPVNVYYLVGKDTVEEKLLPLIDNKKTLFNQLVDGEDVCEQDILQELFNKYK